MKISLSWIFDHIAADWRSINSIQLTDLFNQRTAEIEEVLTVSRTPETVTLATITSITNTAITAYSPETNQEYTLSLRPDGQKNGYYLVIQTDSGHAWAGMNHFGSTKEHLLPALHCPQELISGQWKETVDWHDTILEVDNKSITHRPDMWGHRGFAREVATLLNLPLKPIEQFVTTKKITADPDGATPFHLAIEAPQACTRFAGLQITSIAPQASSIAMAIRLCRVDAKPIDAIVDCTNYVMLDLSQPMHAFDGDALTNKTIIPRMAKAQEKLTLLDGQTIELTPDDLVITDGTQPIALAGVMGGKMSGVNANSTSLFLESACFNATTIRKSAARHKIRTEASARFEKSLDPNQNETALCRFIKLLQDLQITFTSQDTIVSLGTPAQEKIITIAHALIENKIGTKITPEFICKTLTQLEFTVKQDAQNYIITIPTFRSSKDVTIAEDVIEEIGRLFGYQTITPQLPAQQLKPSSLQGLHQKRAIVSHLAYSMAMRELYNYSFFDERFLRTLTWEPEDYINVKEPISENWKRLVTSLIPHLLKAIDSNCATHDTINFFEWGRVWNKQSSHSSVMAVERKVVAGIFFEKKESISFYEKKAVLQTLFTRLKLPVTWHKAKKIHLWQSAHQTAELRYNNTIIGSAGMIDAPFLHTMTEGYAWVFELDGDFLLNYAPENIIYTAPSKYPAVIRDISILIPSEHTIAMLQETIACMSGTIIDVQLIDRFTKKEWGSKHAITFRMTLQDPEKTLPKEEAEQIWQSVAQALQKNGAEIR